MEAAANAPEPNMDLQTLLQSRACQLDVVSLKTAISFLRNPRKSQPPNDFVQLVHQTILKYFSFKQRTINAIAWILDELLVAHSNRTATVREEQTSTSSRSSNSQHVQQTQAFGLLAAM